VFASAGGAAAVDDGDDGAGADGVDAAPAGHVRSRGGGACFGALAAAAFVVEGCVDGRAAAGFTGAAATLTVAEAADAVFGTLSPTVASVSCTGGRAGVAAVGEGDAGAAAATDCDVAFWREAK
jgi:hypothetical protein